MSLPISKPNSTLVNLAKEFIQLEDEIYEHVTNKEVWSSPDQRTAEDLLTELNSKLFAISRQAQDIVPETLTDIIALMALSISDSSSRDDIRNDQEPEAKQSGLAALYAQQYIRNSTTHPIAKIARTTDFTKEDTSNDYFQISLEGCDFHYRLPTESKWDMIEYAARQLERQHPNIKISESEKPLGKEFSAQEKVFA